MRKNADGRPGGKVTDYDALKRLRFKGEEISFDVTEAHLRLWNGKDKIEDGALQGILNRINNTGLNLTKIGALEGEPHEILDIVGAYLFTNACQVCHIMAASGLPIREEYIAVASSLFAQFGSKNNNVHSSYLMSFYNAYFFKLTDRRQNRNEVAFLSSSDAIASNSIMVYDGKRFRDLARRVTD